MNRIMYARPSASGFLKQVLKLDVLFPGCFVSWTFCIWTFVNWTFCILDVLYHVRSVTGRLVTGRFVTGRYGGVLTGLHSFVNTLLGLAQEIELKYIEKSE